MIEFFNNVLNIVVKFLGLDLIATQWYWWMMAFIMVGADFILRTLYLFMIGIGFFVAGIMAARGFSQFWQQITVLVVGFSGFVLMYQLKARAPKALDSQRNTSVQNDVGNMVTVLEWNRQGEDFFAKVKYRASQWSVKLDTHLVAEVERAKTPQPGEYEIVGMEGTTLLVKVI